jgi:hypothetical protein
VLKTAHRGQGCDHLCVGLLEETRVPRLHRLDIVFRYLTPIAPTPKFNSNKRDK